MKNPAAEAGDYSLNCRYNGPQDDAIVAAAKLDAEASGKLLIIRNIVTPPERALSSPAL